MECLNLDNKALIILNFLPEDIFEELQKTKFNYKTEVSTDFWEKGLFTSNDEKNFTGIEIMTDVCTLKTLQNKKITDNYKDILFKKIGELILECPHIPTRKDNMWFNMLYYEYKKGAGINWHDDSDYTLNFSLYIHNEWDPNWGGETLIDTKRGVPLVSMCTPNTLVCIKSGVSHKVCPVTVSKIRKVLQCRFNALG